MFSADTATALLICCVKKVLRQQISVVKKAKGSTGYSFTTITSAVAIGQTEIVSVHPSGWTAKSRTN